MKPTIGLLMAAWLAGFVIVGLAVTQPPSLPIKRNLVDQPGFTNTFNGTNAVITSIRMVSADEWATNALVFSNRLCLVIDGKVKAFAINPSEWGTLLNDKRIAKTNFQTKTIRIQLP